MIIIIELIALSFLFVFVVPFACNNEPICLNVDNVRRCAQIDEKNNELKITTRKKTDETQMAH